MTAPVPDPVTASAVPAWSDQVDVLVVGFGIAGGCAAVEPADARASVLVLERAAVPGGTSAMAGGHFYLGGGTAVQQATGHDDSPDEMFRYLMAVARDPEPDKIRAYCDGSVETSTGWRGSASGSSAATTRTRRSSSPAPSG